MSDREKELERVLKYVLQKAERYGVASDATDQAKRAVIEASREGKKLDVLLDAVKGAAVEEIQARQWMDCVVDEAWELMGGRKITIELKRAS